MSEVTPEVLKLCGFTEVERAYLQMGAYMHLNFIGSWTRLAVTTAPTPAGSALGGHTVVTIWGIAGAPAEAADYAMHVRCDTSGKVGVMAMCCTPVMGGKVRATTGAFIDLSPPTPLEMLASVPLGEE